MITGHFSFNVIKKEMAVIVSTFRSQDAFYVDLKSVNLFIAKVCQKIAKRTKAWFCYIARYSLYIVDLFSFVDF